MTDSGLREGQPVGVFRNGELTIELTVVRVMKRFAELGDGSKWLLDGSSPYPRSNDPFRTLLRVGPVTTEHRIARRLRLARERLTRTNWAAMSDHKILEIMAALGEK